MKQGAILNPYLENSIGSSSCMFGSLLLLTVHLTLSYLSSKSAAIQILGRQSEMQKYGYVFEN